MCSCHFCLISSTKVEFRLVSISHQTNFEAEWSDLQVTSCVLSVSRKSHCGDKTVVRSSYLNGPTCTDKTISLYWIRAQLLGWFGPQSPPIICEASTKTGMPVPVSNLKLCVFQGVWRSTSLYSASLCFVGTSRFTSVSQYIQCMKRPVAHSLNSTWFWIELPENCCEPLKFIMKYISIQFCERPGHGRPFHALISIHSSHNTYRKAKNCIVIRIASYIIVYSYRNLGDIILHFIY